MIKIFNKIIEMSMRIMSLPSSTDWSGEKQRSGGYQGQDYFRKRNRAAHWVSEWGLVCISHIIAMVFELFQNCHSRIVVPVALCWSVDYQLCQALVAAENTMNWSAIAVKGIRGFCHDLLFLFTVTLTPRFFLKYIFIFFILYLI